MKTSWLILLMAFFCQSALAANDALLRDPTRPADAPDAMAAGDAAGHSFRLDMVIRPVGGKPSAIINGETVKLGREVQGMKLIAIRESSVVLRGADGKETVTLVPGVEKTMRTNQINRPASSKKPGSGM